MMTTLTLAPTYLPQVYYYKNLRYYCDHLLYRMMSQSILDEEEEVPEPHYSNTGSLFVFVVDRQTDSDRKGKVGHSLQAKKERKKGLGKTSLACMRKKKSCLTTGYVLTVHG